MPLFKAYYSEDFEQQTDVEEVIKKWNQGDEKFKIYTSGTTSKPKKITLTRKLLIWSAKTTQNILGHETHQIMCCLPVNKTGGFMQLIRALVWDCEIHFYKPSNNPLEVIKNHNFTTISLTPTQFKSSFDNSFEKLNKFNHILIGGAPLNNPSVFIERLKHPQIWCTYGMTETSTHIAIKKLNKFSQLELESASVYKTLPDVNISKDKRSCLVIHAPKVSDETIITNDVVELITNTKFIWKGRIDHVVNSGGVKLHPEEIEQKLSDVIHDRFFVAGIPDEILGEKLILLIEGKNYQITKEHFSNLSRFEIPKETFFLPKFLETGSGKIHRYKTLDLLR